VLSLPEHEAATTAAAASQSTVYDGVSLKRFLGFSMCLTSAEMPPT
jgi:hypothetical protein